MKPWLVALLAVLTLGLGASLAAYWVLRDDLV